MVIEKWSLTPIGKIFLFSLFHLLRTYVGFFAVGAWNLCTKNTSFVFSYARFNSDMVKTLVLNFRLGFMAFLLNIGGQIFYFTFSIGRSIGILLALDETRSD